MPAPQRLETAFLAALLTTPLAAARLPELVLPQGVGVNIHFVEGHERDLDLISAAGVRVVRMDFGWGGTERRRGEYTWTGYDELTSNLERRGLLPYYILDYSNGLYEESVVTKNPVSGEEHRDTASPQHPESVAAFARWAAAATTHYRGRRILWEIWNEPNITFWKPRPDVEQYITLALATCRAIREADPQALIVAPATSGFAWEFMERFLQSGVLEYLDAVSVHPYRNYSLGPETVGPDYARLRKMLQQQGKTPKQQQLPILSGEWGYATHSKGLPLETQAAFLVRQQLVNLWHGVPVSIWYDWKNDGSDPAEREHHFGTVLPDLQPKPAYRALQTLTQQLAGFRVKQRLGTDPDYLLLLENEARESALAAWTTGAAHPARLPIPLPNLTRLAVVTADGSTNRVDVTNGEVTLPLSAMPLFARLGQLTAR